MKRPGTGVIRSMDAGVNLTIKDYLTLDDHRQRQTPRLM